MLMKKLSEDHYIICDDSEITTGDIVAEKLLTGEYELFTIHTLNDIDKSTQKKITHSTQPLGFLNEVGLTTANLKPDWTNVEYLPLSEVKEVLGIVDVENKAFELAILFHNTYEKLAPAFGYETRLDTKVFDKNSANGKLMIAVCKEIYQALEDNKEKKYTYYDIENAFNSGRGYGVPDDIKDFDSFIKSIQPTEWEVEFINGKLQLVKE